MSGVITADALAQPWPISDTGAPWRNASRQRRAVYRASVPYGDEPGQLLDVWRRADLTGPAPVLVFIPGGAWIFGSRVLQGHELMAHLVELGWVCLSVQYRTSPKHRWPRQIIDVKAAIAWARVNADEYGGDRTFVAVAGCSAGGHMATLVGLTPGDPQWQAALPASADTSVDAVVSLYGRYDWEDRSTPERARFMDFLERVVVKRRQDRHPELFRDASPLARVNAAAPPFFVLHGDSDVIIPVGEALCGTARHRSWLRPDRRHPSMRGGASDRVVPRTRTPRPPAHRGGRGRLGVSPRRSTGRRTMPAYSRRNVPDRGVRCGRQ